MRPLYVVSCKNQWSFHWWGAFNDYGLFGFYSLENAAQEVLEKSQGIDLISKEQQFILAKSTLLRGCAYYQP